MPLRGVVIRGDALALPLANESVDVICTSPPYFGLRDYEDGGEHCDGQIGLEATPEAFLEALWAVSAECARVLKPSGSMFVNLGDKYAGSGGHNNSNLGGNRSRSKATPTSGVSPRSTLAGNGHTGGGPKLKATRRSAPDRYNQASDVRRKSLMGLPWLYALGCTGALAALGGPDPDLNLILRAELVWSKPNGLPESVTDRARRSHEQWFHLTKSDNYYSAVDEIREPHTGNTHARRADGRLAPKAQAAIDGGVRNAGGYFTETTFNPAGKLPGSVWSIPSEPLNVPDYFVEDDQGWRMLDSRPLWRYVEHRCRSVGDWSPVRVSSIDHFAAFPQEWPRRLILGWSPPGICLECSEGRRPVVEREQVVHRVRNSAKLHRQELGGSVNNGFNAEGYPVTSSVNTITGYSCACSAPDAPTRPAVVLDPFVGTGTVVGVANTLGRHGVGVDLSADYLRLARWRVEQSGHFAKTERRTNQERQGVLL